MGASARRQAQRSQVDSLPQEATAATARTNPTVASEGMLQPDEAPRPLSPPTHLPEVPCLSATSSTMFKARHRTMRSHAFVSRNLAAAAADSSRGTMCTCASAGRVAGRAAARRWRSWASARGDPGPPRWLFHPRHLRAADFFVEVRALDEVQRPQVNGNVEDGRGPPLVQKQ